MIIPKESQALERLKSTLLAEGYWQDVLEDFVIIENALNEYYRLLKEDNETTKKLKALEIIKKYNVRPSDYHYNTTYDIYLCNMSFVPDDEIMSKEEYDLLKDILQ